MAALHRLALTLILLIVVTESKRLLLNSLENSMETISMNSLENSMETISMNSLENSMETISMNSQENSMETTSMNSLENSMETTSKLYSRAITNEKLITGTLTWTCPFKGSIKDLNESENWYKFLNSLYCKFSEYAIQVSIRNYTDLGVKYLGNRRVLTIKDRAKKECDIEEYIGSKAQNVMEIDDNNVKRFLSKTAECNISKYDSFENFTTTSVQLNELNRVLKLTLNNELYVICEEQNIFFKGSYITTGDIILTFLLLERGGKDENCKKLLLNTALKTLNIFALNTFFVDFDIDWSLTQKHSILKMNIIAPKWKIIGTHKIELKGKDGELHGVNDGKDGKPGKPGGPGGNFFGIGNEFLNGKKMKISVNGGDGSSGQDGRNGEAGKDGASPATPSNIFCGDGLCDENNKINGFDCQKIRCEYQSYSRYNNKFELTNWCEYEIFGKTGTGGSDGGNGGMGGKGGNPGIIVLFELNRNSQISLFNYTGQNGKYGKGGVGGIGGKRGNHIIVNCRPTYFENIWSLVNSINVNERADSGRNGTDGISLNELDMREAPSDINYLDLAKIINQYKSYLRENLHEHLTNYSLNLFLMQLENNHDVKSVYDTLGFIHELKGLEEQFHMLSPNIKFIQFYKSLLNRIWEYAKTIKDGYSGQFKKVLAYLYTVVLGRIYNMEDNLESNLIININQYIKNVKEDIKELKNINNAKFKEDLINKYKEEYKHEIDIKINEAKELISKEVTPEIDNIETDIDAQIETLINEVKYLQEQTKIEHEKLTEKQQQLQTTLGLQGLFSILKTVGHVVSFLGPVGAIAGTVIGTGSTIAESFLSDNDAKYYSVMELPQSVDEIQSISGRIKSISDRKITCLKNTLERISLEILKHPDILSNISLKIVSMKDKLDKMDMNGYDFRELIAFEKELETTVQIQEADSSKKEKKNTVRKKEREIRKKYKKNDRVKKNKNKREEKSYKTEDPKTEKNKLVMRKLQRIVQMGTAISETYNKYKNDRAKLDTITYAIKQNEENFEKLKHYEQKIYITIMPMLQNIKNDLDDVIFKLGTKSKVALDVTKWQVKSTLRDMLLRIKQLTSGLKPQDNLARCIEKLEEAMVTIIDVNSHIQDYQGHQNYASFIAKISSVSETDISIANDPNLQDSLRTAIRDLEITIRSNIIVQRHKVAMNALKQIVFPFAHDYFKDLILPAHLEFIGNKNNTILENLVSRAETEIGKINMKLEEYKNTVGKSDGCNGKGIFISGHVPSKPFFVWKNEQNKNVISRLLSGDAVIIKAHIRNSAPNKDAIKFNVAEFHFKSENETLQSEIDSKLKGFQLSATHLGNSYYRYNNKFYKMMTGSQEIWYYFKRKLNGEPFDNSDSYDKFKNGNLTLSPYASWKIKLDIVGDNSSFTDLQKYNDVIDMVLEGRGHYLSKISMSCPNIMADKYYQPINTIYEDDLHVELDMLENIPLPQEKIQTRN